MINLLQPLNEPKLLAGKFPLPPRLLFPPFPLPPPPPLLPSPSGEKSFNCNYSHFCTAWKLLQWRGKLGILENIGDRKTSLVWGQFVCEKGTLSWTVWKLLSLPHIRFSLFELGKTNLKKYRLKKSEKLASIFMRFILLFCLVEQIYAHDSLRTVGICF